MRWGVGWEHSAWIHRRTRQSDPSKPHPPIRPMKRIQTHTHIYHQLNYLVDHQLQRLGALELLPFGVLCLLPLVARELLAEARLLDEVLWVSWSLLGVVD